jgi:predicted DNA-binding protein (MmcQ/YjbR family)
MGWVQVLNPGEAHFAELQPLLREAYGLAVKKFEKKTGQITHLFRRQP